MPRRADRTCNKCDTAYSPTSNRQKYCSKCQAQDARHFRGVGKCESCQKEFDIIGNVSGRFCSVDCGYESLRKSPSQRECPVCKLVFKPSKPNQKCCTRACGAKLAGLRHRRNPKICPVCQKSFNSRHGSATCSRKCATIVKHGVKEDAQCRTCGKPVQWTKTRYRLYCSRACRAAQIGTKRVGRTGYTEVKTESGWKMEHRHVMEQLLKRPLLPEERVHHKNGDRSDNRPENIELWLIKPNSAKDPAGQRRQDLIDDAMNQGRVQAMESLRDSAFFLGLSEENQRALTKIVLGR